MSGKDENQLKQEDLKLIQEAMEFQHNSKYLLSKAASMGFMVEDCFREANEKAQDTLDDLIREYAKYHLGMVPREESNVG